MKKEDEQKVIGTEYFKSEDQKKGFADGFISALVYFSAIKDTETSIQLNRALKFNLKVIKSKNNIAPEQLKLKLG